MKALGLIGEPCVGKTSVVRAVIGNRVVKHGRYNTCRWTEVPILNLWILGVYDGHVCDGTDRLSMNCYTDSIEAVKWIKNESPDANLLWEGDRMNNRKWLNSIVEVGVVPILWCLVAMEGTMTNRRRLRMSKQSSRWAIGIRTKVASITAEYSAHYIDMTEDGSDKVVASRILDHFGVNGLQEAE